METKKRKIKWWYYLIGLCIAGLLIQTCIESNIPPEIKVEQEKQLKEEEQKELIAKAQADSLLSASIYAEEVLKKSLKDPESYDKVETKKYFVNASSLDKGDFTYIQVKIIYRATNSFGGTIQNTQCFNFDKKMLLIETFECN